MSLFLAFLGLQLSDLQQQLPSRAQQDVTATTEETPNETSPNDPPLRPRVERPASLNNPRRSLERPSAPNHSDVHAKKLKFQPKSAIRRTKEEREATERAEAERLQARLAASDASSSVAVGRGGSRGRGDGRGAGPSNRWQGDRYAGSGASGFLGGATPAEDKRQREALLARSRGGGGGGRTSLLSRTSGEAMGNELTTRVKKEADSKPNKAKDRDGDTIMGNSGKRRSTKVKKEQGEPVAREESDDELFELEPSGRRINIENINLISDGDSSDESLATPGKGKEKEKSRTPRLLGNSFMRPIRIDRHEHVERAIGVNTEASSLTSAELRRRAKARGEAQGSLFLDDDAEMANNEARKTKGRKKGGEVEFLKNERKWQGVYRDEEDEDRSVRIKEEPREQEEDAMVIDGQEAEGKAVTQDMLDGHHVPASEDDAVPVPSQGLRKAAFSSPGPKSAPRRKPKNTGKASRFVTRRRPIPRPSGDDNEDFRYHEHDPSHQRNVLQKSTLHPQLHQALPQHGKHKKATDPDNNAATELEKTRLSDRKGGVVYLFQLPPLLPTVLSSDNHLITRAKSQQPSESEATKQTQTPASETKGKANAHPNKSNAIDSKVKMETPYLEPKSTHALAPPSSSISQSYSPGILGDMDLSNPEGGAPTAIWSNTLRLDLGRATDYGALSEVMMFNGGSPVDQEPVKKEIGDTKVGMKGKGRKERAKVGEETWALGGMGGGVCVVPDWEWLFGG
ncbi:MAG: hypothetical protein Q9218_005275 [Villophora microphyllina]